MYLQTKWSIQRERALKNCQSDYRKCWPSQKLVVDEEINLILKFPSVNMITCKYHLIDNAVFVRMNIDGKEELKRRIISKI